MPTPPPPFTDLDRRSFLSYFAGAGLAPTLLPGALWARVQEEGRLDANTLKHAERTAGLAFTDEERELMLNGVNRHVASFRALRSVPLSNDVPPALHFDPRVTATVAPGDPEKFEPSSPKLPARPDDLEELAFLPVTVLSGLIRERSVKSFDLTSMYVERLKRLDPLLHCLITLTEDRAFRAAEQADVDIKAGRWKGPLHGVPWGAKDLLAVRGYKTTWGATPFKDQVIDEDAAVVERLDQAGAVLIGKLALGALAWGDVWFGETTRNPWDPEEGSSGSSAGPASATAAGLMGFTIGSETLGSIVSPATRCGCTGLRPTFGRVSRRGAMALSWSMDKLGPLARSVEDCALVLRAIHGRDDGDPTTIDAPFSWTADVDPGTLRVGYVGSLFDAEPEAPGQKRWRELDREVLETLRSLGMELVPIELPDLPIGAMSFVLNVEAAAAFDDLTRSGRDDELVRQVEFAWPNSFRQARMIPAVEYVQANRVRTLAMREMEKILAGLDAYVTPSYGGSNLLLTNLTGHPCAVVPSGFTDEKTPVSITFMGALFGEERMLAVAKAYQDATDFHTKRPPLPA